MSCRVPGLGELPMVRSAYSHMTATWQRRRESALGSYLRAQLVLWRRQPTVSRIERPTRLDRARAIGYRAKQGFVVVRVRVRKGGARKQRPVSGRRPKALGVTKFTRGKSLQVIAEERAKKRYPNLRLLNSYFVGEDGVTKWYEAVLIDPQHPNLE